MTQMSELKSDDETLDTFYHGRILILQKKKGYRFSVDSPLLADFIQTHETDELLELGAGSGIISLLLSIKPFKHITGVEIQETLADLATRNVALNKLEERISIICQDFRSFHPDQRFDVIFSNPPYIKKKQGHLSSDQEKSIAKHEVKCDIFGIMAKTAELLKKDGRAYFIYPVKREEEFKQALGARQLKMKAIRFVLPRRKKSPNFFLTECDTVSPKTKLHPPLILFDDQGHYTPEAEEIFSGRERITSVPKP
jgi:tRNA1Val (adenine37-N6)-methyltransferase